MHTKIAIALPIEDKLLPTLSDWGKRFDWSHIREVHLIHIVKRTVVPLEFGLSENPSPEVFTEMKPTLNKFLASQKEKIIPHEFKGDVFCHVYCDYDPEEKMIEELKNTQVSLVVVATQGKKGFEGLFHSSFTDHMIKFSPCDVYVVRPNRSE